MFVFVIAGGCGGSSNSSTTPTQPPRPKQTPLTKEQQTASCRPSVAHLVDMMTRGHTDDMAEIARIRAGVLERCVEDTWSEEAIRCFGTLETVDGCEEYLTATQNEALGYAIENAII